jgi:hypothetical protein
MNDRGYVGAAFLAMALFLAAAGMALALYLGAFFHYGRRSRAAYEARAGLESEARKVVDFMSEHLEADADSPLDPLWSELAAIEGGEPGAGPADDGSDGCTEGERSALVIRVRDLSSAINPNFIRKDLLEDGSLGEILALRTSPQDLQQYREDRGLSCAPEHYAMFFEPAAWPLLSCYGWANINTADEFSLRLLYRSLTGSTEGAAIFREKIQSLRRQRRVIQREELAAFLGSDAAQLFPIVCAEPSLNVNYVDREIARELLVFPKHGIKDPDRRCDELMNLRSTRPVREEDIQRILGVERGHVILQLFGSRTWFWEVRAKRGALSCALVVARLPDPGAKTEALNARLSVIQTGFEP